MLVCGPKKKNIFKENQRSDKEDVYANSKEYFTAKSCQLGCSKNAECEVQGVKK